MFVNIFPSPPFGSAQGEPSSPTRGEVKYNIQVVGQSEFCGIIYAPDYAIDVSGESKLAGNVFVKSATVSGNGKIVGNREIKSLASVGIGIRYDMEMLELEISKIDFGIGEKIIATPNRDGLNDNANFTGLTKYRSIRIILW